jgi:site-specific DNA-adenine methylase
MGSKDTIAERIIKLIPPGDHFYDLFGGGFSITHAMLLNRPHVFKQFHFNEIRPGICELIQDAIAGKYSYENFKPEFVTREQFFSKKDTCAYTRLIWSFGNNGTGYLFGKEIEAYKKSMHNAIVFNEFDDQAKRILGMDKFAEGYSVNERRLFLRNRQKQLNGENKQIQQLQQLQQLGRLEQLEQLKNLRWLLKTATSKINFTQKSYEQVPIKPNSVIYCDPPYRDTASYDNSFDHDRFESWAAEQEVPVFVSEYTVRNKALKKIAEFKKRSLLSGSNKKSQNASPRENLYANMPAMKLLFSTVKSK